jgi:GNAT superfamily N-acetyltransferase
MTPADTDVLVRPYAHADRAPLLELLRGVWPHKRDVAALVEDRWWWRHDQPPIMVAEQGRPPRLVGLCAFMPFNLVAHGTVHPAAWLVDFFVLPGCQGRGVGSRLTRAVQDRFAATASLSQTEMAYRVFQKLGWRDRMPLTLYMHPLPRRWMVRPPAGEYRVETSSVESAGGSAAALDALWSRLQGSYPVMARRTGAEVLARYAAQGARRYQLLRCHTPHSCAGYMVVRPVQPMSDGALPRDGLIVDYLVPPGEPAVFQALLHEAVSSLIEAGVRRIYCLSTVPACRRVLAWHGFLSPSTPVLGRRLRGNTKWLTFTTAAGSLPADPASWHLTLGDCDLDHAWHRP